MYHYGLATPRQTYDTIFSIVYLHADDPLGWATWVASWGLNDNNNMKEKEIGEWEYE
jgi:hypothetical protein